MLITHHVVLASILATSIIVALTACKTSDTANPDFDLTSSNTNFVHSVAIEATVPVRTTDNEYAPRHGGFLRVPSTNSMVPDPAVGTDSSSMALYAEIYSELTRIIDDPNNFVQPDLAQRYDVRDGGRVYEFILKKG